MHWKLLLNCWLLKLAKPWKFCWLLKLLLANADVDSSAATAATAPTNANAANSAIAIFAV